MDSFLQFLLESAVCLALFYSVYWLFLRNETYFMLNRAYLVSALVASLALPLINLTSPFVTREVVPLSLSGLSGGETAGPVPSLSMLAAAVYGLGVVFLGTRFLYQLSRLARTIRSCPQQECRDCRYVFIDGEIQPFSFFRYVFLNRENIPPDHLPRVLAHERVHIKQLHSMDSLLMEIVTILQWFNPFVWPYKKSLKETHEYLADHAVIAQGCSASGYQLLILEQHVGGKLVELAHNFHQSQIKRRITMMTKIKSKGAAKLKLLCVLPLAAFLVLVLAEPKVVAKTSDTTPQWQEETGWQQTDVKVQQEKQKQDQQQKMSEEEQVTKVKKEREIIQAKIKELELALEQAEDNGKKKEIKAALAELINKDKKIEAWLNGENGNGKKVEYVTPSAEEIRNKIEKVKQKLEETDDPDTKKELETLLKKLTVELKSLENGNKDASADKQEKKEKKKDKK